MHVPLAVVEDLFPESQLELLGGGAEGRRRHGRPRHRPDGDRLSRAPARSATMAKQRLVVIGNGMAGARTVEEILARGGGDLFDITMFGDEPYGNYNRILLSNVLNGVAGPERDLPQPARLVRGERRSRLHAGVRVDRDRPRRASRCSGARRRSSSPTTSCSSPPAAAPSSRRSRACSTRRGSCARASSRFRTLDDCHAMIGGREAGEAGGGDRRRPARARGGARPADPRLRGARRPPRRST